MSEHHLHPQRIRRGRGQVRSVVAAVLGVALAGLGATACTPEPPPALAVCPARTEVPLEPVDPVHFSLPRAVSPDGEWLVASRVVGTDLTLSLRRTQTAGVLTVASSATVLAPRFSWMVGTPDGRTVVISHQSPLGQQLVAERCA